MENKIKFILNTTGDFFNKTSSEDYAIREFLENSEINILSATLLDEKIVFQHQIQSEANSILFYKISHSNIPANEAETTKLSIGILSLEGGIIKSIYNSISRIFSPHLTKRNEYTPEISRILENLQTTLGSSLGLPESGIQTIQDEVNYWTQKSSNSPTKSDKEKAKIFAKILDKINSEMNSLWTKNSLSAIEEFLDSAHGCLDEIWRLPHHYPQNRMKDIMDVICLSIIEICVENMLNEDIWNINSFHINTVLSQVSDIAESWIQLCDSLTRLFWPNYSQHLWLGEPHIPKIANVFKTRLTEIKDIKNLHKQLISLFCEDDSFVRSINAMFRPFKEINIFDTSPIGQQKWNKAVKKYELILEPTDDRIASTLKSQIHNHLNNPRQVVHIFSKYDIISQRPSVLESLTAEREHFLQSIKSLIKDLQSSISENNESYDNNDLSRMVWETRWLKVAEHQIYQIVKILHILKDRNGFDDVNKELNGLKEEIKTSLKSNFESWCDESLISVKSGELTLRDDKSVVEFEKTGRQLMRVTFNPKLVTFCNDVREFENLGYRVPIELRESATHAKKFMSYARSLQQIASFHNTIGDRMIPCQRPIMLKNAMELSNLVKSESVAWNDEESVSRYVLVLQTAVQKLSKDNTILAGYHEQAKKTVIKLMSTDLIRQGQIWKDEMRHLRDIIGTLESQGYTNLQGFKLHWDHQLYKVLEFQYISGLTDLNQKIPDIYIEIVFRQQQLQFRPPIEEIQSKYYTQLRKFLERPLGFRGLSDQSSNLFKMMVDRNRDRFSILYKKSDNLFEKLSELKDLWKPWVALGCIDMDQLCNVHLSSWEDWDSNFKACKHFSQQIAKIQNSEERLDCFVINLSPLRSDIESISRRYWETLTSSLRSSIFESITNLQEYLQNSLQVLQNVPLDETGISDAGAKYEKITQELPKMTELIKSVQEKDTCLAGWCKERVSSLTAIIMQWEQLQPLVENHHSVLQRQIDIMKDHLTGQMGNLNEEVEKFQIRWESTLAEIEANDDADFTVFKERQHQWTSIKEKMDRIRTDCEKFSIEFPLETKEFLEKVDNDVKIQGEQWEVYQNFQTELEIIADEEWTVYRRRPYIFTDFLSKWSTQTEQQPKIISSRILTTIDKYQNILSSLQCLQSDSLTERHWAKLFTLLDKSPKPFHDIRLKDVLSSKELLAQNSNEIQNLVRQAASEQVVRLAIVELEQWGVAAVLKLTPHSDSKGKIVNIIRDFQDVLNKIGDNQCLLQSAKNSAAFEAFSDQAEIWEGRLNSLDRALTGLNQIQRKWIYLEPIFGAGTLRTEEAIFLRIDKDFRYVMNEISQDPRVLSICKINNITSIIDSLENQLSRCQNTLRSFITAKRNAFPRFYFLGNDDLLEILGQASKENIIQKHIKKLFPGINRIGIKVKDTMSFITSIHSAEGDEIKLKNMIHINGPVENWLNQLVIEIKLTLQEMVVQCCNHKEITELEMKLYPMQILCLTKFIDFTKITERSIGSMKLQDLLKSLMGQITNYTELIGRTKDNLLQIKYRSILIDLVHQRSIIEHLIANNVTNIQDWHWLQQLKYYLNSNQSVSIKMVYAEFEYSFEYLGNSNKLVNTLLTHKCYLTLTQAMHLGLGGNPFGPAGTGKTECVKALGAMLGRLVLVFNCNENVDTEAMGLILTGLARCGAWGCFDEFNRLQEATLSAISMLIQPLQTALKEKQEMVAILDDPFPLNTHCGIFVTLNPAGEDYGGRQNLPGNLQALFRPIVMQQPEPKEIARVLLFVEGFKNADRIGSRMVELFSLASKMLSPQRHYDWGLRELKTVLTACGKSLQKTEHSLSDEDEMELALMALRINTMSKLTLADCKRFDMLVSDVFPNTKINMSEESELKTAIEGAYTHFGYKYNERQVEKCLELNEQLIKRMGVVVVGPPSSGKTTLINLLKQALHSLSKTIKSYTIAPKSMTRVQLLGHLDPDTRQWMDGVLTNTAVIVNSEALDISSWIICDGDVDPEWIEALNSVLDDNKLLTLPSGWRIQFNDNVNFIFETHDLSYASPATISRMGIVNLSSEDLNKNLLIESWLTKQSNNEILRIFIEKYFIKALEWIESEGERPLKTSTISLTKLGLQHLTNTDKKEEFCIHILRGLGSTLEEDSRNDFSNELFNWSDVYVTDPLHSHYSYYNASRDIIEIFETDEINGSESSLVRTPPVKVNFEVLINFLKLEEKSPFLIYGPNGSGKTLLLENVVAEFSGYQLVTIKCSSQLTSSYILYILRQNCLIVSGVRGREYRPKQTKLILYLKNIDLCPIDSWNTCEVIELLLQLINRNGFSAENLEWISITGLQIACSMSSGSKQTLSERFLSVTNIMVTGYPTEVDMQSIVRNEFRKVLNKFKSSEVKIERIVDAFISIYREIKTTFTSDISSHYIFTPKMITKWITQLVNYPDDCLQQAVNYEAKNIFRNRLISEQDLLKFDDIFASILSHLFTSDKSTYFFTPERTKSSFLQYTTDEIWRDVVQKNISICEAEDILINRPITEELLKTTASICLALSRPETNLVICGKIGSGRKSSIHIACSILHIKIMFIQPGRLYSLGDFYNDLKMAMQSAAMEDQTVVLLIDHAWINYLNDLMKPIEAVLEGSEISDLFGEDLEVIANPLRSSAQLEGYQESLASYFLKRVKTNLHIVINLESTSTDLNDLFSKYPALYRNTELIWLQNDSDSTLDLIPKMIIEKASNTVPVSTNFTKILQISGDWSKSPQRYVQLINTYLHIYTNFSTKIKSQFDKLQAGVEKLSSAHSVVDSLKNVAKEQEIALGEKRKLASQALEMISATMRNATDQRTDLLELKQKTQKSSEKLMERKKAIELELKEVEPLLQEASNAVGQIKTEALSEIRSLRAPPDAIRDILEGVLRLMGIRDTSWNSMKSFLAKRGVKEDIRSLDPSRISPENCKSVEKLLVSKADSFNVKNAKRASVAAAPLAAWVTANVQYSKVCQSIKPLEREQNELQKNLSEAENEMKSLISGLDDVDSRVKELSDQLNVYTQEAAVLEIKLEDARTTLKSAETLIEKLGSEYEIWSKQSDDLGMELKNLEMRSLIISVCLTHLSHLNLEERSDHLENIYDLLELQDFKLEESILIEQDKLIWETMGLTPDSQSMQNAALLTMVLDLPFRTTPIPLLVDPSGSCYDWLQSYLSSKGRSFEISSQSNDRFSYNLELAVRFGKIFIVQDVNGLSASLLSVILSETHSRFNKKLIQVGNKLVDLHDDFKLIMVTKMTKIKFSEDVNAYITNIPFTVTISGLTDQLLSKTILLKRPELEQKRTDLLRNEGELWKKRLELQDKLLHELSTAQGDILKNEKLIKTLNEVKESSNLIDRSLTESIEIRKKLMQDYEEFKPLCQNSASFYVGISKMYSISVTSFTALFLQCVKNTQGDDDGFKKTVKLTYMTISRSVPKSDHIALALCTCKTAFSKQISEKEWESFITNFIGTDDQLDQSYPQWIKKELGAKISSLKSSQPKFYDSLQLTDENLWRSYAQDYNKNDQPVIVTDFQKILVSQILRPDLMVNTIMKSAARMLGLTTLSMSQISIQEIIQESKKDEPIILIALSGTNPSKELKDYADEKLERNKYTELSVGKDHEKQALAIVRKAAQNGQWICLKNIHLAPNLLKQLDTELQSQKITEGFRLWLTCESTNGLSDVFISKCNQILYEPPDGLKNKILRLLQQWNDLLTSKKDSKIVKLYVSLFVLYSTLQERRTYIPQGWCNWYDFGDSDLRAAIDFISWMEKSLSRQMDWSVLQGLCESIAFGGRIANSQDSKILLTHLQDYFDNSAMSHRWTPPNLKLIIPQTNKIQDYYSIINQMGDIDSPENFGLSMTSNMSRDLLLCRNLLKQLRSSYFNTNDQGNFEKRIKPIFSLWKKLTNGTNVTQTYNQITETDETTSPWKSFILSELRTAGILFIEIHRSLVDLHNSMKQLSSMTIDENKLMLILCENQVPLQWRKIWSGPKLASDYLKAVTIRSVEAEKRYQQVKSNETFGKEINFAGVFNVSAFLAALKLTNARQLQQSACDLILTTNFFTNQRNNSSISIVQILPVLVDGGIFKNGKIFIQDTNDSTNSNKTSNFELTYKINAQQAQVTANDRIDISFYSNSSRDNLVCTVEVPIAIEKKSIIYSGLALIVPDFI